MSNTVRVFFWNFVLCLMAGCSTLPPKPPECKGEFRPINIVEQKGASFNGTGKVVRCEDGGKHGVNG